MKELLISRKGFYGLLFLVLFVNVVFQVRSFGYSFFSLWDESYLLLKCKEAYSGILPESNLWNLFAVKWFPYLDLTNKIQSSWASILLMMFSVLNASFTAYLVFDKKNVIKYLSLFLLAFLPTIMGHYAAEMPHRMGWGTEMNYVVMEVFLMWGSLSAFIYYYFNKSTVFGRLALLIAGIFVGLGVFVILPSTCLILGCYFVLLIVINWGNVASSIKTCLWGLLGICIALAYVHFFIIDLGFVWIKMQNTAHYITKSGLGYTPLSFLKQFGGLLLVGIQTLIYLIGVYGLAECTEKKYQHAGGAVYVTLIVFAVVYLHNNYHYTPASLLFFSVAILPYLKAICKTKENQFKIDWFVIFFLMLFPALASIGTNTSLYGRIGCFMCSWVFLWLIKEDFYKEKIQWYVILGAVLALLIPITYNNARTYYQHDTIYTTCFSNGASNVAELSMSPQQKAYFDRIHVLFNRYGYKPNESVVFASYLDYCTVYVFDAKLSNNFHMPGFFPFVPKEDFLIPDFIILSDEELNRYHLEDFSWGWPEQYDKYFIGSPETVCQKFIGEEGKKRWLYCRKTNNVIK